MLHRVVCTMPRLVFSGEVGYLGKEYRVFLALLCEAQLKVCHPFANNTGLWCGRAGDPSILVAEISPLLPEAAQRSQKLGQQHWGYDLLFGRLEQVRYWSSLSRSFRTYPSYVAKLPRLRKQSPRADLRSADVRFQDPQTTSARCSLPRLRQKLCLYS